MSSVLIALLLCSFQAFAAGDFKPLFNGKNLTGWKHVGDGGFTVADGLLRTQGGMGLLYWQGGKIRDGVLRVVYRSQNKCDNSGVFIRIPLEPREPWMPVHYGYEVQIDCNPERFGEDDHHYTGTLYSFTKALARPAKPGPEWNTMEIRLDGLRTVVTVNGVTVTNYKEGDAVAVSKDGPRPGPRPIDGYFGLQNHGQDDIVEFKEVSFKSLQR